MSWLARLEIDADIARVEDILDSYAWHKKLWDCFPNVPDRKRTEIGFLTRIDTFERAFRLWIIAKRKPSRPQWCPPDSFAFNEITASFLTHRYYAFDLRANPVKAAVQKDSKGEPMLQPNGKRKRGKRVPLVKPDELRAWFDRKAIAGGFCVVDDKPLEIAPMVENYFRKKGQTAYHGGVQFRGILEVTDTAQFSETYYTGIGSAKGFGFGLLLLAPVKI